MFCIEKGYDICVHKRYAYNEFNLNTQLCQYKQIYNPWCTDPLLWKWICIDAVHFILKAITNLRGDSNNKLIHPLKR